MFAISRGFSSLPPGTIEYTFPHWAKGDRLAGPGPAIVDIGGYGRSWSMGLTLAELRRP